MGQLGQLGQLDDVDSNEDELTGDEAADLAGDEAADGLAGEDDFYREMKKRKEAKQSAKAARQQYAAHYVNEDFELEEGESRKATQKILKNRGLVPSRPKENRNPRVKKQRTKPISTWERSRESAQMSRTPDCSTNRLLLEECCAGRRGAAKVLGIVSFALFE